MSSDDHGIVAHALAKRYRIGESGTARSGVGESLAAFWSRRGRRQGHDDFWALRDVSFEIPRGEVLGLIGGNGAGKSTLLKVLSRITTPTEGWARVGGRLGSLLEVGTGFHPELTGRENVYLNGSILGMSRTEVRQRFDSIVDFAETGEFIDTPVKRFSSGMYTRLAFAVAAFLETEILLVDEVLAVGDVSFQRRCLGKMSELSGTGRTVIFVSHNLGAVAQLCDRALWLEKGRVRALGLATDVIDEYTSSVAQAAERTAEWSSGGGPDDTPIGIERISLGVDSGTPAGVVDCDDSLCLTIDVSVSIHQPGSSIAFLMRNSAGTTVVSSDMTHADPGASETLTEGLHRFDVHLPPRLLAPDRYSVTVLARSPYAGEISTAPDACQVEVVDTSTLSGSRRAGVVGLNLPWRHSRLD